MAGVLYKLELELILVMRDEGVLRARGRVQVQGVGAGEWSGYAVRPPDEPTRRMTASGPLPTGLVVQLAKSEGWMMVALLVARVKGGVIWFLSRPW